MNIPLALNVGDTVWLWRFGEISSDTVNRIFITLKLDEETKISYQTTRYDTLSPDDENKFWFRSRQEVVDYVQKTVIGQAPPEPNPPKPTGLSLLKYELINKLFSK